MADLTPLKQGCAGFHLNNGRGAPVVRPVPRLVRALLVRHLQKLSLRQTEEEIDNHLLYKSFVGYGVPLATVKKNNAKNLLNGTF